MPYLSLVYLHLATVVPAFFLGSYLLLRRKGTPSHKRLGRAYLVLMFATALLSLFIKATVGPRVLDHFGLIHLLSVLVLFTVPRAYWAARQGEIAAHQRAMILLYVGGLLIAGGFTLMPGRLLHSWLLA